MFPADHAGLVHLIHGTHLRWLERAALQRRQWLSAGQLRSGDVAGDDVILQYLGQLLEVVRHAHRHGVGELAERAVGRAKTVMLLIELSDEVSPAVFTSAASVVSSGLCEAAVTTGSVIIPCRLPMPLAGTMTQSGPKVAEAAAA